MNTHVGSRSGGISPRVTRIPYGGHVPVGRPTIWESTPPAYQYDYYGQRVRDAAVANAASAAIFSTAVALNTPSYGRSFSDSGIGSLSGSGIGRTSNWLAMNMEAKVSLIVFGAFALVTGLVLTILGIVTGNPLSIAFGVAFLVAGLACTTIGGMALARNNPVLVT